ncbi:helix-turn-helix domain-containing protein [Carnobacterium sp. FSL E2-0243]|uniref:helix-turn-helix domain-containing protein n=1 Tax=Carnobacterium sp. FSL E2-0243 TaxID=2921365 RepID=UPI0030F80BE9
MEQDILSNLGSEVRKLRVEKRMTQQELAEKCELSLPFINLIENNKRNVSLETLVKLLSALEVSLSDFFLPFSQVVESLAVVLLLLQESPKKAQYIELFTQTLKLSEI